MDEIEELEDILDAILLGIQEALQSGEPLSEEFQEQIANEITLLTQEIDQLYAEREQGIPQQEQAPPQEEPIAPEIGQPANPMSNPPSPGAQLMWILAGQKVDAFVNYLATYPDPELRALLNNRDQLDHTIHQLHAMMPSGEQPSQGGIPHADINSSNIYGFRYDPKTGKLLVRFQGGSVYGYDGVPGNVFKAFQNGAIPAKTNGRNRWGVWWRGKMPSLGASFYELIRQGGYPYRRLN